MYNLRKNNYHLNPKPSNIQTPLVVSQFIFELLGDKVSKEKTKLILDPCCGERNLLEIWTKNDYLTYGIDIDENSQAEWKTDFLKLIANDWKNRIPALILCNPPFNGYGNKLGSEVWLDKIIELFGKEIPIALFTPMGFRLNSKKNGKRWNKFINRTYPPISSIISLPRDIFSEIEFHSEILIFNVKGLESHYFFKNYERTT